MWISCVVSRTPDASVSLIFSRCDRHQGRAQHAVGDRVALLQHADHGVGFLARHRHHRDGLVLVRVELAPAGGAISITLLRSSALLSWRRVASVPSRSCSGVASWMASPASRLSSTGSRLSAKPSIANLRALEISSSARRRVFWMSAWARRNWSASSAFLACSAAISAWAAASASASLAAWAASRSSGLGSPCRVSGLNGGVLRVRHAQKAGCHAGIQ